MTEEQNNLTDEELGDLSEIVAKAINDICIMADKHNIDRDSMLKCFADMIAIFADISTIQGFEIDKTHSDKGSDNVE